MKVFLRRFLLFVLLFTLPSLAQDNRIRYNNQDLFLSGCNLAWLNFARDIGPGETGFSEFGNIMLEMHDNGGNALRWWLHTNGVVSPAFDGNDLVTGPGAGAIEDLRTVLDLAWEREIGLKLCLWSFDMLRLSNSSDMLRRNRLLLEDTTYTRAYINNALIPMVDSLAGHPAIIAWEIFNEPEGMSNEFGWADIGHVAMADIQRFVNLCTGAIHRSDPNALVTNGTWSFLALTDITTGAREEAQTRLATLSTAQKRDMERRFTAKYDLKLSAEEIIHHFAKVDSNTNYYRDDRLIAAGGDPDGVLDFYSVHYYDWAGTALSPFHWSKGRWQLNKPLLIAEFHMIDTFGIPKTELFERLHLFGYAGALPWSWTDNQVTRVPDMLAGMLSMWQNHRADVDVLGIGGDWPLVSITSPDSGAVFGDSATVEIVADASDADGSVGLVEFYADDLRLGESSSAPFTFSWSGMAAGQYFLSAVATDDAGHQRTSRRVPVTIGTLTRVRLEAEDAELAGTPSVESHPQASGGRYLRFGQNGTVTYHIAGVPATGTYQVTLGYRSPFGENTQYIHVNGVRTHTLVFPLTNNWTEMTISVDLLAGSNEIQMELFWGWMDLDYMDVPAGISLVAIGDPVVLPQDFVLEQNYPNPFNPATTIGYHLPQAGRVTLSVFDLLGREIAVLESGFKTAGRHTVRFDGENLPSGVYFYRLRAGESLSQKRMILVK